MELDDRLNAEELKRKQRKKALGPDSQPPGFSKKLLKGLGQSRLGKTVGFKKPGR
jgi:hypothetical protein